MDHSEPPTVGGLAVTWRRLTGGALLVASVATAGSLTYSLGLGLYPCRLCWYQRILMYPLVVVLAYALARDHRDVHLAVLPMAALGTAIAAYHSYLQVAGGSACSAFACATVQRRVLGLTIPNQSLVAFLLVVALVGAAALLEREG
jgi:disulfide bond formation protein DsbB